MKAVIAHYSWDRIGGADLLCAYVAKVFLEYGYKVSIVSISQFSKEDYIRKFGINLEDIDVYSLCTRPPSRLSIYYRLAYWIPLSKAIKREKPQIFFTDTELYKPVLKLKRKIKFKILEYLHFPYAVEKERLNELPKEYSEALEEYLGGLRDQYKKYRKGLWKYYYRLWLKLYKRVARENPFNYADVVMSNSKYTARLAKILWGKEPVPLNPPVRIKDFMQYSTISPEKRENAVVMISRISPEKRIEEAIEAVALTKTKPVLRILGRVSPYHIDYKKRLEKKAEEKM